MNGNDLKRIREIQKYFYKNENNSKYKAFIKYHNEKTVDINTRSINRTINEKGSKVFLELDSYGINATKDIRQCKIRHELLELENKRGRISNETLINLTKKLIFNGNSEKTRK